MAASFLNRLAEAWWRQLLSVLYRARGYILIYDRHFLFEAALPEGRAGSKRQHPIERLQGCGFDVQIDLASDIDRAAMKEYGLRDAENIFLCRRP